MKTKTNLLKTALYLFMGAALWTSCSKDDDKSPSNPENPSAPFEANIFKEKLNLPESINSSSDPKAKELSSEFDEVTAFKEYSDIMTVPPGATISNEPVQTGNGKPGGNAMTTDYTVYTYSYGEMTMIYQFSVQNGYDVFELFYDYKNELGIIKFFEIRQSLDGTHGTMSYFGNADGSGGGFWNWEWTLAADGTIYVTMDMFGVYVYEMVLNPDNSGHLEIYTNGNMYVKYTWTASGSGTWNNYSDGTSGSWQ